MAAKTIVSKHGQTMRRITVTLDQDVYELAKQYARDHRITLSAAVNELVRKGLEALLSLRDSTGRSTAT